MSMVRMPDEPDWGDEVPVEVESRGLQQVLVKLTRAQITQSNRTGFRKTDRRTLAAHRDRIMKLRYGKCVHTARADLIAASYM